MPVPDRVRDRVLERDPAQAQEQVAVTEQAAPGWVPDLERVRVRAALGLVALRGRTVSDLVMEPAMTETARQTEPVMVPVLAGTEPVAAPINSTAFIPFRDSPLS
jgi:hypothetical protein